MDIVHVTGLTALLLILGIIGLVVINDKYRSLLAIIIVFANAILTSIPSILSLTQGIQAGLFAMPHLLGNIIVRVDPLSAWFILIINFTTINGVLYGSGYLKAYIHLKTNRLVHWIFFLLFHVSMLWVCMFENGFAFLISWEMMSLSSLMLVIFEFQKKATLKAGVNYMVQMHLSVILLTLGFIWMYTKTGSFNFASLSTLTSADHSIWIFVLLLAGFAIKAGFIPFHSWLPHAHPAAPSHISGVMSGVIVKLGIYGIIRVITNLQFNWILMGEFILAISVITAIYGITNAAVKYDFKRMLAFCTIENIGIIGIGIGLGLIGMGKGNTTMIILGFGAALMHTLNHSLFKSLLFFAAGNVYQQTHTRNMERLGGLIKKMPVTAVVFLIGALSISGLPPFNGFVSEFLIYSGLLTGLKNVTEIPQVILIVLAMAGLAIAGSISLLTFSKSFGVIFLGNPRKKLDSEPQEANFTMNIPQFLIIAVMLSVAIFPQFYFFYASKVVFSAFSMNNIIQINQLSNNMVVIGRVNILFIGLLIVIFGLRWWLLRKRETAIYETWGCGYIAPIVKAQYTGRSFTRSFGNLFSFLMKETKDYNKITKSNLYPGKHSFSTYYFDLLEKYLIIPLARRIVYGLNYFQFIQNGQIQSYVIYGLFFIILVFLISALNLIY